MIDKHARLLAHFQIEMLSREGNQNVIKFFILQHNPSASSEAKTTYRKYLRVTKKNEWGFRKVKPIKKVYLEKPSQDVLDVYLPMQTEFKAGIRKRLESKAIKEEKIMEKEPVRKHKEDIETAEKLFKQGLDVNRVAEIMHRTPRCIRNYRKEIEMEEKRKEKVSI